MKAQSAGSVTRVGFPPRTRLLLIPVNRGTVSPRPFSSVAKDPRRLSRSVEDYLKAIYSLTRGGAPASTTGLAEHLAVQPSSVTGMVKRLAGLGLLAHIPYRGVQLTEEGSRAAIRVIRRHRILETYLTERLGYAWEEVHDEAERLEHTASDRLIDAMARALGDPRRDPHGAPIPTAEGKIESASLETLADVALGEPRVIQSVRDDEAEGLRTMEARGLVPGARVLVRSRLPGAPLEVQVGEGEGPTTPIPPELAERIFVQALP